MTNRRSETHARGRVREGTPERSSGIFLVWVVNQRRGKEVLVSRLLGYGWTKALPFLSLFVALIVVSAAASRIFFVWKLFDDDDAMAVGRTNPAQHRSAQHSAEESCHVYLHHLTVNEVKSLFPIL